MDGTEPIVVASATRHGIVGEDAIHAWAFAVDAWHVDDGMVMYVGPPRSGALLEVGVVEWHGHWPSSTR